MTKKKTKSNVKATKKVVVKKEESVAVADKPLSVVDPTDNGLPASESKTQVSEGQLKCNLVKTKLLAIEKDIKELGNHIVPTHEDLEHVDEAIECLKDTIHEVSLIKFKK